ncbi:MAG: alpha/beta hydrolase [Oleiphilaceae bacterium]|nr:alpha/beta hydrolase [Oleiphilaceae bacterium]
MQYRQIALTPRLSLSITEAGLENSGPTVVLIHGWCGHRLDWNPTLARLQNRYPMMSIDLPGHGDSTEQLPPGWSVRDLATVLVEALKAWDKEAGRSLVLVGHSMGGAVALEAARELKQVRSVILVDTFILPYGDISEEEARKIEQPFFEDFPKALDTMVETFMAPIAPPMHKREIKQHMCGSNPFLMLPLWSDLLRWSPDDAFDHLGIPIHAINGDMIPSAAYSRCADHVTEWRMPRAGHFPHIEMPQPFHELLEQVIKSID